MSTLVGSQLAPQRAIPRSEESKKYLQQTGVLGETRRFRQLDRYQAHYSCTQYAHLQYDWWGQNADNSETVSPEIMVPFGYTQPALAMNVRQKRPTAPYNLCKAIVDRFTGLLFSDQRRPTIEVEGDDETEDYLRAATDQMRFWAKLREARAYGGSMGAALVTVALRGGKFMMEVHNPKHCQVMWADRRALLPRAVLICYRYPVEEDLIDERTREVKGTQVVNYLYRRIITETEDTVYKPVKLDNNSSLDWEEESSAKHDLGFFPGVWVQNLAVIEDADGEPDCQGSWQNFDTMDRLLSQMNKAILLNLDPTVVISVDPKVIAAQGGISKGSDNALMVGQGGSASYMEITGSGVSKGQELLAQLKQNTLDVCRCVLIDPQTISGAAQSAKAIEYIYAPMLEKADDLRAQWGDLAVVPLLEIIEKIARKYDGQTVPLAEGKSGKYAIKLPPKKNPDTGKMEQRKLGPGGYITIVWGPYFSFTEQDKQTAIGVIAAAKGGGLIDTETAVRKAAAILEVSDPDVVLEKLKEEEENQAGAGMGGDFGLGGGEYAEPETDEEGEAPPEEPPPFDPEAPLE